MNEIITAVVTLVVVYLLQFLKPEWFVGWFMDLTNKKFRNREHANKMQNSLGAKAVDIGVELLKGNPDNPVITEATKNIKAENEKIKNELKNVL